MSRLPCLYLSAICISFFSCNTADPEISKIDYLNEGNRLTTLTSDTLSRTMQTYLQEGDFEKAIKMCKAMAPALTGTYDNAATSVRRTANRVRNPANIPDEIELPQLDFYQKLVDEKGALKPKLVLDDKGTIHYFKPIILQPQCLNCHGVEGKDIAPAVLARLKQEYPMDGATGYASGDLRGLWHITFHPFGKNKR